VSRHRLPSHHAPRRPRPSTAVRLLVAAGLVAGAVALLSPPAPPAAEAGTPTPRGAGSTAPLTVVPGDVGTAGAAEPVRLRVPAIGVDSPLALLGVDPAGALVPPADPDQAGWFTGGPAPGDIGPAVIAGHVDSASRPAVFSRLPELAPGDEVLVDRADGTAARFTVTGVGRYPKSEFPTEAVYGPTPRAELRLVTCGGDFDRSRRSYTDNVVVTARLT
jgi:hypothetical protein